jgi:hypothetical protein
LFNPWASKPASTRPQTVVVREGCVSN